MITAAHVSSSPGEIALERIVVLPKTDFTFATTANLNPTTKLAVGIDSSGWRSAELVTLVHRIDTPWQGTGTFGVIANGISITPEDPSVLFNAGVVVRGATFGGSTLAGTLDIVDFSQPIPSLLEVVLSWTQGATAVTTTPNTFAISVHLIGRRR